ncbi:carboxypeptidase-like regulatory domain-containing protein [Antarcticibacterium arcticum]|uniref:Carboxypeptidase-like regulatory domain-containing protein n=1 Tax=Antarcticibacterium arcticum TaxID=2585771 RepID=A0A5B8YLZ6_9FLAO|nr:DUF5686 family protein [Antarcticibacterium arcticum]QED38735.1 carboxypeptidase-like regulatory domain-containing protein [Antarcticibacterium arcticum]
MRSFIICILLMLYFPVMFAQQIITGKVIDRATKAPLPFAKVYHSQDIQSLTNIKGEFSLELPPQSSGLKISYPGYVLLDLDINKFANFYHIQLSPLPKPVEKQKFPTETARDLVQKAINCKEINDPELYLKNYSYSSYNKLFVDTQQPSITPRGRNFLSERVSKHLYKSPHLKKEIVTGVKTPGFEEPVYEVLTLNLEPKSIYKDDYPIYGSRYASPLGKKALKNYEYKILDTVITGGRPGYMLYFKPKRPRVVAGWEGIIFIDTLSFAVQGSRTRLNGQIEIEIDEDYEYFPDEKIWFPIKSRVTLKPGTGGKDISIFGGSIALGTVQRKSSILNTVLAPGKIENDLQLTSVTNNYDFALIDEVNIEKRSAAILVLDEAHDHSINFWEINRQQPYTLEDEITAGKVEREILTGNILRKKEVLNAISQGFYPVEFWDFDLSKFIKYNNYEGFRIGAGGETNEQFSRRIKLEGYLVYGFKDRAWKYAAGGGLLLHRRSGTWWNLNYTQDIREVAGHQYLKGVNDFSILEPRFANISYYYAFNSIKTSLEHRFTPRLDSELQFAHSDISQLREYAFLNKGVLYRDYTIAEAKLSFLWRPFSKFLSTPHFHKIYDKRYPVITGQLSQGFSGVGGGNFNFTKLGLKAEYEIIREDRSVTQVTMEGNYGLGELPLTHAFHAFPNNPNKPEILNRFSVAGKISFETMYFDEFFSDRQASVHIRHQLRPFHISKNINPEFAIISRHVIGDFKNIAAHRNIKFQTLEQGFNEVGLELNQIFLGLGLSTVYRYGAYHLPTFRENFSLKFTLNLKI